MGQSIKVKVKFYASLREKLGIDERILVLENPSFASLLDRLAEVICGGIDFIVKSEGELRDNVMVSVNSSLVHPSDLRRLTLNSGDRIEILPLPTGG